MIWPWMVSNAEISENEPAENFRSILRRRRPLIRNARKGHGRACDLHHWHARYVVTRIMPHAVIRREKPVLECQNGSRSGRTQ